MSPQTLSLAPVDETTAVGGNQSGCTIAALLAVFGVAGWLNRAIDVTATGEFETHDMGWRSQHNRDVEREAEERAAFAALPPRERIVAHVRGGVWIALLLAFFIVIAAGHHFR